MDPRLWEGCGQGGAGAGHYHGGRSQRLQWMRPYCELARDELGAAVCMRTGWVVLQMAEGHILC